MGLLGGGGEREQRGNKFSCNLPLYIYFYKKGTLYIYSLKQILIHLQIQSDTIR